MTNERSGGAVRVFLLFAVASLAAVGIGALICAFSGVPAGSWVRNLAAWAVGAALAVGVAASVRDKALPFVPWIAAAGLLMTLVSPDQEGVHRWIDLGPLHINLAMVVLPASAVALAATADRLTAWLPAFLILGLLVVQPDASQATTMTGVMVWIALARLQGRAEKAGVIVLVSVLAVVAWMRPDPLAPVEEVEGIVMLGFALSPVVGGLALLAIAAFVAIPAIVTRNAPRAGLAGQVVALCFALWAVTPLFGAFPVPLVGIGMSPILGAWLGVGLLAAGMGPSSARP